MRPRNYVHCFDVLPVVESRKLRLIAHLVEHLNFIDNFCRQVANSERWIISEKRLSVDQNTLDGFSVRDYRYYRP